MTCSTHSCAARSSWTRHRPARSDAAPPAPVAAAPVPAAAASGAATSRPTLVCLLASHTSTLQRADALAVTLASIRAQQPRPPALHVSWSASPAAAERVAAVFAEAARHHPVHCAAAPKPLSQFEHLREIVRRLEASGEAPEWVCFTDDDDLWSERRAALYLEQVSAAASSVDAVVCGRKTRPSRADVPVPNVADADGVRALLASGAARFTRLSAHDVSVESFNMDEYFDYAVRFDVLRRFVTSIPRVVITHKLCDLAFTKRLRAMKPPAFTPEDPAEFVYWYSRSENTPYEINSVQGAAGGEHDSNGREGAGASTGVEVNALEVQLGRSEEKRCRAATGPEYAMDETMLAFFLSALRQGIEQELVQLRVDGPSVSRRQTDEACARQLDAIVADHPLRSQNPARYQRFRSWALGVATGPILRGLLGLLRFDLPR